MMSITTKLKDSISETFRKIEFDQFDERDVKALLVDIREYIRDQSLLRELANFVAHPIRDQGISHKLLNARYAKLRLIEQQKERVSELLKSGVIKTEQEYSEAMLSSIDTGRIEKRLFKILFIDGIEDIKESDLIKYYKLKRSQAIAFIENSYFLSGDFYILKNIAQRNFIHDLLKYVRGTVTGQHAFTDSRFNKELQQAIALIIERFSLDPKFNVIVKKKSKAILLCIMCLLHDARITFFDGNEGRFSLADHNGVLGIYTLETVFQFELFVSDILTKDYISPTIDLNQYSHNNFPFVKAVRNTDGKLQLVELQQG